jgi:predicted  nucleic acid-binding Zn-ribbon protein
MSNKSKTPQTLVEKIKAKLKLGEDGKLMSFFERLNRNLERKLQALIQKKNNLVFNFENRLQELNDAVEDARQNVTDVYESADVTRMATNASQDEYMTEYLSAIDRAESALESAENAVTRAQESHNSEVEALNKQISALQARIARVTTSVEEA